MVRGQGQKQRQPQEGAADGQQIGEAAQLALLGQVAAILTVQSSGQPRAAAGSAAEWLDPEIPAWLSSAPLVK
jgi:hypothetical protein